jgi:hypothetical protein
MSVSLERLFTAEERLAEGQVLHEEPKESKGQVLNFEKEFERHEVKLRKNKI